MGKRGRGREGGPAGFCPLQGLLFALAGKGKAVRCTRVEATRRGSGEQRQCGEGESVEREPTKLAYGLHAYQQVAARVLAPSHPAASLLCPHRPLTHWLLPAPPRSDKDKRERERQQLQDLVGKNLTYLSQLDGLSFELYRDLVGWRRWRPYTHTFVLPIRTLHYGQQTGMLLA